MATLFTLYSVDQTISNNLHYSPHTQYTVVHFKFQFTLFHVVQIYCGLFWIFSHINSVDMKPLIVCNVGSLYYSIATIQYFKLKIMCKKKFRRSNLERWELRRIQSYSRLLGMYSLNFLFLTLGTSIIKKGWFKKRKIYWNEEMVGNIRKMHRVELNAPKETQGGVWSWSERGAWR